MTLDERARALEPLGFTPRQARFLTLVALHSGYCVRRQYETFAGVRYGKNVRDFLDGLVDRRLADRFVSRADRGHIYHLNSRTLYRLLDQENSRHRRTASAAFAARKLMLLDYVLAHPGVEWLATEAEKLALFSDRLGVPRTALPQVTFTARAGGTPTVRYFPHKWPSALVGEPPVMHFVALVTDGLGRTFEQFLGDHAALLRQLPAWTVIAIAPRTSSGLATCQDAFRRFLARPSSPVAGRPEDIRWYLATRRAVEQGDWARLSVADIDRFRTERARLDLPGVDALYRDWLARGETALHTPSAETSNAIPLSACRVVTEVLPFDYSQFGSLPGVA